MSGGSGTCILSPADWKAAQSALPAGEPESASGAPSTIQSLVRQHILGTAVSKGGRD